MLNSRKSFSSFSPSVDKTKSPRRKTMDARSLPSFDEAENNINSANKRRYSLRSPGLKKSSGISLFDESGNMSGSGNLLNLSDYVADRLDESCFSIHSEEGKTEASASKDKKSSRRDTFEGTIDLDTSEMDASNVSNFSFGATNDRRNTVDQNDMSAMLRDLEDSEDDNQSQLQISISTSASSVHGMNILDVTGESSEAPKKRRRSSISTLGHSEGAPESDFMFSPARSTRSRASKPNTPVPSAQSSALRRSARSPARPTKSPIGMDLDEESVQSTRRSPRSALKANRSATPNFLDTTNSFSASKLGTSKSDTPDFLNQTNTLPEDASTEAEAVEALHESRMHDLLGMDEEEDEEVVDLRSAKKSTRRDTADFTEFADLLGDLDASQDASMSMSLDADASRVSHTSSSTSKNQENESVSSVNTMELNLKVSEIMGETPTQLDTQRDADSAPASPVSTLSRGSNLSSLNLEEAHSQASTANLSDLSIFSASSASKKGRASSAKKQKQVKTLQSVGPAQEAVIEAEVSVELNRSARTSAAPSPAVFNRRETMDANDLNFLDQSDLQSVASEAADRPRRTTMDPADLMNILDSSDLQESAHKARRTTIDAADIMDFMNSSELQSPAQDDRRATMDSANMSALLNFSTTSEVPTEEKEEEDKEVPDMLLDDSASGFGSFAGRDSIDLSVLQEMVANRLNDNNASAVLSPAASVASSVSYSVFSTRQGADRRDTVDPSSIMGILEDESNHMETSVLALSTSNLSAHSQSYRKSPAKPSSTVRAAPTTATTSAPLEEEVDEVELTEELSDDGRSDNGTVNAADLDLLNDTMSTNQSFQTVATLDLQMLVEHRIEEIVRLSEDNSDAESEMTSDTIGTLAGFLDVSGMVEEDTQHVQVQKNVVQEVYEEVASVQAPKTAESPASVLSNASSTRSSRSDRFTRPKVPSSPAPKMPASPASSRSTGSRRSRSSLGSSDTPDSFDHTAELSVRSAIPKPMKTFGKKGRASLSTSVVLEAPVQRKNSVRRASVGPIATTAPATSPAKSRKAAASAQVAPPSPAPTTRAADLSVSGLNDSSMQAPASVLKSCLSSRKTARPQPHMRFDGDSSLLGSSLKRNVVFGSPQACEFHKTSPTTNFTPLHKDHAKSLFSMDVAGMEVVEETTPDVVTEENDEVMDHWERLTNASEAGSSDDEPCEEFVDPEDVEFGFEAQGSARGGSRRGSIGGGRRRDSKRMPSIALDVDSSTEASEMSLNASTSREGLQPVPFSTTGTGSEPAEISISPENSFDEPYVIQMEALDASVADEDATGTVCLPGSLAELVAQSMAATSAAVAAPAPVAVSEPVVNANTSTVSDASRTEEIEVDLQALMRKMHTSHYRGDTSSAEHQQGQGLDHEQEDNQSIISSYSDAGSQRMSILEAFELSGDLSMSMQAEEGQDALGALIGRHSDASTIATMDGEMQGELDTSVHSTRSTRSTRSSASRASAVSVDSKASKGSKKGAKKGKKGESPATATPAAAQQQELSMSMHSTTSVLEISALEEEDNTYQGTLAAMVNTLAAPASAASPAVEAVQLEPAADLSVHSAAPAVEMSVQEEEDETYQLEGSLAAMINTLAPTATTPSATAAFPAAWQGSEQEISVIEGAAQEDMECDFSALESPRPSGIAADSSALRSADADVSGVSGSSRVMRRSAGSRGSGASTRESGSVFNLSHSDLTHETFGEFSLLASNEEEEENIRALAATNTPAAPTNSIMSRLQNLNKGARSNSLLQAGTPVIRPEQSRMSIGFKRQSMAGGSALNASVNMSVMQAPKSAVKSTKKARREVSLVVEEMSPERSILSATPSMAKVYGGPASPTVQFSANPLRGAPKQPTIEVEKEVEMVVEVSTDSMDQSVEVSTAEEVSVLNETSTDYVPIVANLRAKLYSFFSAVQTVKTVLSTYSVDVRAIVQTVMESHIESAYVDSPLQHVPLAGLTHAWTLSAPEAETYVQYVLDTYPQCYKQQRMSHPEQHHDQLWVNMCAKTIIDNTGALKRAQEAHDAAQAQASGDRFYNKALNRDHSAKSSASSDFSALLTAQQAQVAAQVKRDQTELLIDIVNKLTYCRVTTFTSSLVRISATLSPTVSAELAFQLQRTVDGAGQAVLSIQDVLVDLSIKQDSRTPKATQAQNLFVTAYFASVMCADELDGPLSQKSLLAAAEPSDIPDLLHKVSASIAELRWALLRHATLSAGGFKCIVAKTTAEQGGFKALITVPRCGVLHVPVRDFVAACGVPQAAPMGGFVVSEKNNEEVSAEEREELLSQLQVRLDSCLLL